MPIRGLFARRPGPAAVQDENIRPGSSSAGSAAASPDAAHPGFERVDTVGSKASSAFSIRSSRKSLDTGEYKLSVVNDSGVYLPPSPVEREPTWPRRYLSRTSSDHRRGSSSAEIEHFPISRESFDSYRRSFDISARSPVAPAPSNHATGTRQRQSLDSNLHRRPFTSPRTILSPRASLGDRQRGWAAPPTPEESETGAADGRDGAQLEEGDGEDGEGGKAEEGWFEEVRLNDDGSVIDGAGGGGGGAAGFEGEKEDGARQGPAPQKKKGFFARFGPDGNANGNAGGGAPAGQEEGTGAGTGAGIGTAMARFLPLGGRRQRAQSGGQGAELGFMSAPDGGMAKLERGGGLQAQGVQV